ncbi:MAG: hypothetical protein ABFQ64_05720 [Campylobacterota bacterium]
MPLIVTFIVLFSTFLSANIYDEYELSQDANSSKNYFFSEDFDEIIRFDAITFEGDNLTAHSLETLREISQKVDSYKNSKRKIFVTLIGHIRSTTDDENEKRVESDTYANAIQNSFRDSFDTNQSARLSISYVKKVKKYLLESGVDKEIIELEHHRGLDKLFSSETAKSKT